ncbi:MAG: hypothetical protein DWB56_06335 [Candidatus Jettenia sp.]|uniref:Hydroxylamine oxidoreductase n=1 Tax=Candidatus Jettenia caeni TaxID=247490 RepID=I3IR74_9BACT|nr:multiheme c-type cytochrome [Candidatus Jettenia sp. AMX1]MBC6928572.1 hypothetical protein [Candidatus Jettenia sp.]WKZ15625.1 MAG: multiheme c-type cytochrome [Candidatus Jettenia caeni]KAA0249193.1 MAG: hypothetical protein EDM77_09855 [Candidatus Jettenia sp. AMX1]MCE7879791.1 hypothetical protein [Candidatus Jettenia sp. AMX1]MCQ3926472.1 hypothetical protein [Candidatus Jettenia sp.]
MSRKLWAYPTTVLICLLFWFRHGYAEIPYLVGKDGVLNLEMEARPVDLELRPGVFFDAWGYCIKGEKPTVPGPTIKVKEGTKVRIHFTNKLTVPSSIHPHGAKYTVASDGAHIAGNPDSIAAPGYSGTFEWDTSGTPGTWFYHPHVFEMGGEEGISRGLWGAFIVEPENSDPDPPDKEFVVFMHTFLLQGKKYEAFNGKSGDVEFMNGVRSAFPGLVWQAKMGEKVRFHLINSSGEMHTFHTHGHRWMDKASGQLIDNISLAPFTSYVLDFVAGEGVGPGNWAFHCHDNEHMTNGMFGIFVVEDETKRPKVEIVPPVLKGPPGSFTYPDPELKKMFEDFVGLSQGDGPWGEFYKPIPFYLYFNPARHYFPTDSNDYKKLLEKYRYDECVECHEEATPGIVAQWKMSNHANPKKNAEVAAETQEIEELIGKELNNWKPGTKDGVYCSYCHGKDHESLFMPTVDNSCGTCHPNQAKEFARGRDYGKPSHPHSWEGGLSTPWYVENYRRNQGFSMIGCDQCHQNMSSCDDCHGRHLFSAAEARRPEVCSGCHLGPDHPDWESYIHSRWGIAYEISGEKWNWEKKLSEVIPGKDYPTPTCQYCHMYVGNGRWEMNVETKGIWRMGVTPPKEVEFKSSLKDFPYGVKIPPMDKKLEIYSPESLEKRRYWIELCAKCHGSRFSRMWLDSIDQYMFESWKRIDEAQLIVEELFAGDMVKPSPEERPPFPLSDLMVKILGPEKLGPEVYNLLKETNGHLPVVGPILGAYAIFTEKDGNPSGVEREYVEMWFWKHLQGYKGVAHAQQDISWWLGSSQTMGKLTHIQDEATKLKRLKALEDAMKNK